VKTAMILFLSNMTNHDDSPAAFEGAGRYAVFDIKTFSLGETP